MAAKKKTISIKKPTLEKTVSLKWALLIFVLTNFEEAKLELVKTLEMETENLCKKAQKAFLDENKKHAKGEDVLIVYTTFCIQVRE